MMKYIDISEHQGQIDFAKVKGSVDGVILRCGYGQNGIDKQFQRNIRECNRLGIPCGVYFFSYAYTPEMAKKEAERCLAMIAPYRVELPVAFDFEYDSVNYAKKFGVIVNPSLANAIVDAFCSTVEAAGYYCMNYANPDFLNRYMTNVARYDLWLASWPKVVDVSKPPRKCGIWQWGGREYDGITTGTVDTNEAYKDYASIIRNAGLNRLTDEVCADCVIEQPKTWYDDAMNWAKDNGIMNDGRPEDVATRAEVAQMLYNLDKRFSGLLEDD